jgi:hypothetical protein
MVDPPGHLLSQSFVRILSTTHDLTEHLPGWVICLAFFRLQLRSLQLSSTLGWYFY